MKNQLLLFLFSSLFSISFSYGRQLKTVINNNDLMVKNDSIKRGVNNIAPVLLATGNQMYCPGSSMKIVTSMSFTDPDDTGIDAVYIQISSGYVINQDLLTLTGSHPNIDANWNSFTGKLSLTGIFSQPTYAELEAAIEEVEFSNNSANPTGTRSFSITIGQANYLPSNGHYYEFKPNIGVLWSDAKTLAENSTYYGLQGYLATISSADEAQISGEQTTGAGWIGGSDQETEGTWKWMTGPEIGTTFWTGNFTGFTNNFAFWNSGEPNNQGDEDYAHITAVGVGILGSWNDLSNSGGTSGDYQPKGYIVEYGGMPGDPVLSISTSTTLTIPSITSTVTATRCGDGTLTLQAVSNTGTVHWYDASAGGTLLATGNSFTTPTISVTTSFYAVAHTPNCPDDNRVLVAANVTQRPILTANSPYFMCEESYKVIEVLTTSGIMFWYDSPTATTPIFLGTNFVVPNINQDTTYYAEADYNGCLSDRIPIEVKVFQVPNVTDEDFIICENDTLLLDAGVTNVSYLWSNGATSQTIPYDGQANYSVTVTTPAPESCSKVKNFTILAYTAPDITSIQVSDLTVTIFVTGNGLYEYSIDGTAFQSSNVFTVSEGGFYTCVVREIGNDCGFDTEPFIVVSFPQYFTPNNDTFNDTWTVKGISNYPEAEIKIFDRFGKLVFVINNENPSWDGTLNGKIVPASDYWYVAKINESFPENRGHFSLKR
jgi:gliding motility-associated-like protein